MRLKFVVVGLLVLITAALACSDNSTSTIPIMTGVAGTHAAGTSGAAGTGAAGTGEAGTGAAGAGEAGAGAAGTTGAAGAGAAGTTGAAGAGMAFMAIAPCASAAAYVTGTTVMVPPDATTFVYTPACLKVAPGAAVTIGGSTIHPTSARPGGSPGNPIGMHMTQPQTVTFPTAGFYPFQCDIHFALGMMGVIWVSP